MLKLNRVAACQIGNGAAQLEDAVIGAGAQLHLAQRGVQQLLARRSGAQLRLLVIDEGFGTQDIEGRDGLIEVINAIQDDFSCILVITHIDELKDAFNVRIDVEKTPNGSQISIR